MKKLITAGALVIVMASPAFAQKYKSHRVQADQGRGAYAQFNQPARAAQSAQADFTGDPRGPTVLGSRVRGPQVQTSPSAAAAYAQAPQPARAAQPAQESGDNGFTGDARGQVIWGGKVRGQDPDWFIRSQISRGLGSYGAD